MFDESFDERRACGGEVMEFLRLGRAKESRWLCDPKMSESPVFQPLFNSYSQLYSSNNTQAKEMA